MKKKIQGKELAWYIIAGIIALIGLAFVVFGIIGSHFPGKASDNWVVISENAWLKNWSKIGYRYWGIILLGIGAIIAAIALNVFARVGDRDEERALRRRQRLGEQETIEVESEEKKAE